ncbi:MAG: taurine catabolism dioxygenase, TauD/TfdA family protein [Bacteroidetes bacterium]|nr:taurine catabolism dioxygenase, TauD/TfdA family protein [Bacteroidota bacterium]
MQTDLQPYLKNVLSQARQIAIKINVERSISDLNAEELNLLKSNLMHHGIICITNQDITPVELKNFVERWGEVLKLPAGLAFNNQEPGLPEIARVGNVKPDGSLVQNSTLAEYWHHDGDFWQYGENHIINFLHGVQIPKQGGKTGFLDTRKAYNDLPHSEREKLADSYTIVHSSDIDDFKDVIESERPKDARHPVCLPNPFTKELALYLPESHTGIEKDGGVIGTSVDYIERIQAEQGIFEHAWTPGDILIWDNLQVMHRSMGGYFNEPRLLFRCQAKLK